MYKMKVFHYYLTSIYNYHFGQFALIMYVNIQSLAWKRNIST